MDIELWIIIYILIGNRVILPSELYDTHNPKFSRFVALIMWPVFLAFSMFYD